MGKLFKIGLAGAGLLALVLAAVFVVKSFDDASGPKAADEVAPTGARVASRKSHGSASVPHTPARVIRETKPSFAPDIAWTPDEQEEPKSTDDLKAEEAERRVEAFDALTDKWMEPAEKGVALADVDAFAAQFGRVPADRREECLQRALNLIPDENVMLLVGILMDKSQPRDLVELVYNDILNRDAAVKKPILAQIIKDKSHPCWRDTAWILDATDGEIPD